MTTHKTATVEAETLSLVREALQGIISADWLTWEELADPEEFVRWSKPRVNHALRTLAAQAQEIAELRHEIERHVETNAKLATENERLRQALATLAAAHAAGERAPLVRGGEEITQAGVAQSAGHLPSKQDVAGSNPAVRSIRREMEQK